MNNLSVSDSAFEYLRIQRGRISELADKRSLWESAYRAELNETLESITPYLPAYCDSILDIGSGLGGINALLNRYYGGNCDVCLLDGINDAPVVVKHAQTFNHMGVAADFLRDNGVKRLACMGSSDVGKKPVPCDLIVSFASWCFHYPPITYLKFVQSCCHKDTVLIVDVRRGKSNWLNTMAQAFKVRTIVRADAKYDRVVFSG